MSDTQGQSVLSDSERRWVLEPDVSDSVLAVADRRVEPQEVSPLSGETLVNQREAEPIPYQVVYRPPRQGLFNHRPSLYDLVYIIRRMRWQNEHPGNREVQASPLAHNIEGNQQRPNSFLNIRQGQPIGMGDLAASAGGNQ